MVKILAYLIRNRTRRYTAGQIHAHLDMEEPVILRNVQRDLKLLAEMATESCVITERAGGKLYYRIQPDVRGKFTLPIERNGLLAIIMLKRLQPLFAPGAKSVSEMTEALDKLFEDTDADFFNDLDQRLDDKTHVMGEQSLLAMDGSTLNALLTALSERRKLDILYQGDLAKPARKRTVCPVKLVLSKGELYFVCISEYHTTRNYYLKLCRITEASLSDSRFTVDAGRMKRINDRLSKSFGILDDDAPKPQKVVLRFPSFFDLILSEKRYHHSQHIGKAKDGSTLLTMTVPVDFELTKWVLGWMDEVTVVQPKGLRDELSRFAGRLQRKYKK